MCCDILKYNTVVTFQMVSCSLLYIFSARLIRRYVTALSLTDKIPTTYNKRSFLIRSTRSTLRCYVTCCPLQFYADFIAHFCTRTWRRKRPANVLFSCRFRLLYFILSLSWDIFRTWKTYADLDTWADFDLGTPMSGLYVLKQIACLCA
jgi:hypothetical protein